MYSRLLSFKINLFQFVPVGYYYLFPLDHVFLISMCEKKLPVLAERIVCVCVCVVFAWWSGCVESDVGIFRVCLSGGLAVFPWVTMKYVTSTKLKLTYTHTQYICV